MLSASATKAKATRVGRSSDTSITDGWMGAGLRKGRARKSESERADADGKHPMASLIR